MDLCVLCASVVILFALSPLVKFRQEHRVYRMAYIMNRDSIGVALNDTTRGSDGAHTFLVDLSYKHDAPAGA